MTELQPITPRDKNMGSTEHLTEMITGQEERKARRVPAAEDCDNDSCGSMSPSPSQSRSSALTFETQQYQTRSMFMDLPLNIIHCVFDHIEAKDSIALSLACKGLHCHLFSTARTRLENASSQVKLKVQVLLEQTIPPNKVYCPFCKIYHCLDQRYREIYCQESRFPNSSFTTRTPGGQLWKLKYLDARAITNADFFKSPAARETLKTPKEKHENGWSRWWQPKMINEELFLRVESQHTKQNADRDTDEFTFSICKHATIHAQYPRIWADDASLSRSFCSTDGNYASGTCATCAADYTLRMDLVFSGWTAWTLPTGWVINITSWHRLGAVRSLNDPIWTRCAGEYVTWATKWSRNRSFEGTYPYGGSHHGRFHLGGFFTCDLGYDARFWRQIIYADSRDRGRLGFRGEKRGGSRELGTLQMAWMESELPAGCSIVPCRPVCWHRSPVALHRSGGNWR